jgi:hypothetical protein
MMVAIFIVSSIRDVERVCAGGGDGRPRETPHEISGTSSASDMPVVLGNLASNSEAQILDQN